MDHQQQNTVGGHVGATAVALIVAPVVFVVVGGIAGAIYGLMQYVFTDSSEWWINTIVGVVQAVSGTYAARAACDAIFKSYSRRAIFVEFVGIFTALTLALFILVPFSGKHISALIGFAALAGVSWQTLWLGEDL